VQSALVSLRRLQTISQKAGEAKETAAGYMHSAAEKMGMSGQADKKQ
jgi:hypothetical protein